MATAIQHKTIEIELRLSQREAGYLEALLQKYPGRDPTVELSDEAALRYAIFTALQNAL